MLMPLTKNIPVHDKNWYKPILEIIVKKLKQQGFTNLYISVNYQKEIIKIF